MGPTLTIYTTTHCPTCEETWQTATEIGRRFPGLVVRIVKLDDPGVEVPPEVFSVPTYVIDGDVISLGNPYIDQLESTIRRYVPTL